MQRGKKCLPGMLRNAAVAPKPRAGAGSPQPAGSRGS